MNPIRPTASPGIAASSSLLEVASKADDASALPASYAQIRFWLLARMDPESTAFHMPACVRISGPLERATLEQSLQVLNDRHEVLRTTFLEKNGELIQVIKSIQKAPFSVSVIEGSFGPEREQQLNEALSGEARRRFDLIDGPLWRARLFRMDAHDHILIVTLHHIIADGWSQSIFQRELWSTYEALKNNRQPPLQPLDIQYGDFAVWQKAWLASDEAREELTFWKTQLVDPLPILDLITDYAPVPRSSSRGAIATLLMPEELILEAKDLSQSESTTTFALLLACFAVLIYCRTDKTDIVVGSPAANRRMETEPLIGPFAAPIALRLNLSGNPTFREVLGRARDTTADALAHAEFPFSILLDELKVRSVRGHNPLFQFHFLYQTAFLQARKLGNLTVTPLATFSIGTPFELQLAVIERDEGVRAQLEYNPDLFDAVFANEILNKYHSTLTRLVLDPDLRIADLEKVVVRSTASGGSAKETATVEYVAPRSPVECCLTEIWETVFEKSPIGVLDNFFDLGGYSLLAARLVSEVRRQFGVAIDLSHLIVAPTIAQLAAKLGGGIEDDTSHLIPLRTSGEKPPLFCIHGAGGHVMAYRHMVGSLPPDQPVYGLRASALSDTDVIPNIKELATTYLGDIRAIQKHGPYLLCGMSFGGLVAYEMATMLVSEGDSVAVIALFDTGDPAYYRNLPVGKKAIFHVTYLVDRLAKYARRLIAGEVGKVSKDALKFVTSRVQALVWMALRTVGRVTGIRTHKFMRDNVVIFEAVGRAYTPKQYPGRVLLLRAEGRTAEYGNNISLGWEQVVQKGVDVRIVPGDHLSLMDDPNVKVLAEQLNTYMTEALNVRRLEEAAAKEMAL